MLIFYSSSSAFLKAPLWNSSFKTSAKWAILNQKNRSNLPLSIRMRHTIPRLFFCSLNDRWLWPAFGLRAKSICLSSWFRKKLNRREREREKERDGWKRQCVTARERQGGRGGESETVREGDRERQRKFLLPRFFFFLGISFKTKEFWIIPQLTLLSLSMLIPVTCNK